MLVIEKVSEAGHEFTYNVVISLTFIPLGLDSCVWDRHSQNELSELADDLWAVVRTDFQSQQVRNF